MTLSRNPDAWVISLICVYSLIVWFPTRNLPYHWDSAAFAVKAAQSLYQTNFQPFIAQFSEFAHPPLYPALIALFWQFLGLNRVVAHLTVLPFYLILLTATYYLGKKISGFTVGVISTCLLAAVPFVLAELGMPYLDLTAGALGVLALTFWVYRHYGWASAVLCLAVLTKNTLLLLLPCMILDLIFPKSKPKYFLYLLPPILAVTLWLVYHHFVTGWWLTQPGRGLVIPQTLSQYLKSFWFVSYVFFGRQGRYLLTLTASLSLCYLFLKSPTRFKKIWTRSIRFLLITILFPLIIFALTGEFIPRYAIAILPSLLVLTTYIIYSVIHKPYHYLFFLFVFIYFLFSLHPHSPTPVNALEIRLNEDYSYQDHISLGLQAAQFLETNYPKSPVIGGFPQSYQLTDPFMGYVAKPLNFISCTDHRTLRSFSAVGSSILYLYPYHYTQIACQDLLSQYPFTLIKTFNVNGKRVKLYLYEGQK